MGRSIPSKKLGIKLRPYNRLRNCGLTGWVAAHISTNELNRKRSPSIAYNAGEAI
jgi:hypothetical protein